MSGQRNKGRHSISYLDIGWYLRTDHAFSMALQASEHEPAWVRQYYVTKRAIISLQWTGMPPVEISDSTSLSLQTRTRKKFFSAPFQVTMVVKTRL
jgi:hypothetical protein